MDCRGKRKLTGQQLEIVGDGGKIERMGRCECFRLLAGASAERRTHGACGGIEYMRKEVDALLHCGKVSGFQDAFLHSEHCALTRFGTYIHRKYHNLGVLGIFVVNLQKRSAYFVSDCVTKHDAGGAHLLHILRKQGAHGIPIRVALFRENNSAIVAEAERRDEELILGE